MEPKRIILAFALSFLIIFLYQYFFVKPVPKQVQQPVATEQKVEAPAQQESSQLDLSGLIRKDEESESRVETREVAESVSAGQEEEITIETDLYVAVFTNRGAGLKSFVLKKYFDDNKQPLDLVSDKSVNLKPQLLPFYFSIFGGEPFFALANESLYSVERSDRTLTFVYADPGTGSMVKKRFSFSDGSYLIDVGFEAVRDGKVLKSIPVLFGPDLERNNNADRAMMMDLQAAVFNGEDLQEHPFKKIATVLKEPQKKALGSGYQWAAYHHTYFAALFKGTGNETQVNLWALKQKEGARETLYSFIEIDNPAVVFLGPKDERILGSIESAFAQANKVIIYGWFGSIAKLLLKILVWIHSLVPNYGWAIIILTLLLKVLLFPLTYSSTKSMAKMSQLQPKIKAIQKKFHGKKDIESRREMNMEVMALYKQEKVNPAGGCLPLLLQLPILWGFFRLLSVSINVRHEPWMLWISDLSQKDPIYLLPILMGASQFVLQKMTPSTGGDDMQRKIMYIMPIMFVILFASFPSGLNLYWFFSNVLQIGQQKLISDISKKQRKLEQQKEQQRKKKKAKGA